MSFEYVKELPKKNYLCSMFDRMRRICLVFVNVVFVFSLYAQQSDSLQIDIKTHQDKTAVLRKTKSIKPFYSVELSDSICETSGLIYWNDAFWTHNDSRDKHLYQLDTSDGRIVKSLLLTDIVNTDIEEISQDDNYIYLADVGNNQSGVRNDLHVLRINKDSLFTNQMLIDTIWFTYEDQYIKNRLKDIPTDYDCEAFVAIGDSLYLFTKQWKRQGCKVYVLPAFPGRHIAHLYDSLNVKGMITGCVYLIEYRELILCGYSKSLHPFICLFYGFQDHQFFSAGKSKIRLKLSFHQVEAISTADGKVFYFTNEQFKRSLIRIPAKLHKVDLSPFLPDIIAD